MSRFAENSNRAKKSQEIFEKLKLFFERYFDLS